MDAGHAEVERSQRWRGRLLWLLTALTLLSCDDGPKPGTIIATLPPPAAFATAEPPSSPAHTVISIASARALPLNSPVRVSGFVTADAHTFDSRGRKFYIQDESGGIAVFHNGGNLRVQLGDRVAVSGSLSAFNSEVQIVVAGADTVLVMGSGDPPEPMEQPTGAITVQSYGRLVRAHGGVIARQGTGVWLDDGSGSVQLLVIPAGITRLPNAGDAVTVIGVTSRSKGTLQILPRQQSDLTITGRWVDPQRPPPPLPRPESAWPGAEHIKLSAVYPHTYESRGDEAAEAVCIQNTGSAAVDVSRWRITDNANDVILPDATSLAPGQRLWVARNAGRFTLEFGHPPDVTAAGGAATVAPRQRGGRAAPPEAGRGLRFSNFGGEAALLDPDGAVVDAFAYGLGGAGQPGWRGAAVQPYLFDSFVPPAGQVFHRKLDQHTGLPLPDTDTAADWMQDPDDSAHGRRLLYAGWSLHEFFFPAVGMEAATTQLLLGPDHLFEAVAALIDSAQESIDIEVYTFSNPFLLDRLLARQRAGVRVRALFDGGVFNAPDGSYEEDRWVAQQIVRAGGSAWFWTDDPARRVPTRFNNHHQKFLIVDGQRALITSENFEQSSMPADSKTDGTAGNRGAGIITDAPGAVARLRAVFEWDANPARADIQPVAMDREYRAPARRADQSGYSVQRPAALTLTGSIRYEIVQAPESALRTGDALIGMVSRAGAGDSVLVQQQYEFVTWSGGRPNPRLQAYVEAARRGARVLLLLDAVNDSGQNQRTIDFLGDIARREKLEMEGRLGKPAGGPMHNKMVLVTSGVDGWVHISSINGSENSSVYNREIGIQLGAIEAYRFFAQTFASDWRAAGGRLAVDTRSPGAPVADLSPLVTHGPLRLTARCRCQFAIDDDPSVGSAQSVDGEAAIDASTLAEGGHVLYVRQQDGAGVWGPLTALPFAVARTPPSLDIGFDPNNRRLTLTPSGPHSAAATVEPASARAGQHEYAVRDAAGNELRVVLDVESAAGQVAVRVVSIAVNGGPTARVPSSFLSVAFAGEATLTILASQAVTPARTVQSTYDAAANRTTIGGAVRPGPRTVELRIEHGTVTAVGGQ